MDFPILLRELLSNLIVINFNKRASILRMQCQCSGNYLSAICRYLWTVLLSENTGRNRISGCTNAIRNRFTKRSYRKYFQLLDKTTHLTGTTTDLGILFSMFTHKSTERIRSLLQEQKCL